MHIGPEPSDEEREPRSVTHGLTLPPKLGRGKPSKEAREAWLRVAAIVMSRGVDTPSELSKALGVSVNAARSWIAEVHKRWKDHLGPEEVNTRREQLYHNCNNAMREAWERMGSADNVEAAGLLRVILQATERQAKMLGLDKTQIGVEATVEQTTDVRVSVESLEGLPEGALGKLGTLAAKILSGRPVDVIEAELVEMDEAPKQIPQQASGGEQDAEPVSEEEPVQGRSVDDYKTPADTARAPAAARGSVAPDGSDVLPPPKTQEKPRPKPKSKEKAKRKKPVVATSLAQLRKRG